MSKTVEDLKQVYIDALCASDGAISAGIAAVVRALRDEFGRIMYPGDDWNRQGILEQFDQILGAAGDEVAGGSTREDGRATDAGFDSLPADVGPSTPATDICEWEKLRNSFGFKVSCSTKWLMNENYGGDMCPLCDKRIEYKFEPATDPAPAPCLWRVHHETRNGPLYVSQCDGEWRHATADPKCPSCGKPIKFTEAK